MGSDVITCIDCGRPFIWTQSEQQFYKQRNLSAPRRCPQCRSRRRFEQASGDGRVRSQTLGDALPRPEQRSDPVDARPSPLPPPRARPTRPHVFGRGIVSRVGAVAFGLAIIVALLMHWSAPSLDIVFCWLFAITIVCFLAYGYDKTIAGTELLRVPEAVLLALAFAGGTLGAFAGMRYFHHKTAKAEFQGKFWLVLALQIVLIVIYVGWLRPALQR